MMQDESVGWDPALLPPSLSPLVRIYALFLFVTAVATMGRLVALWIAAPPFRLSRKANNPDYLQELRTAYVNLKQWMVCILLACAFVASFELYQTSNRLLQAKASGPVVIFSPIRNFVVIPEMASFVALFLFLVQWHLLTRIRRLDK